MSPTENEKKCWATSLSQCSGGLSREHIVSEAFFEGNSIEISGFDWTGEEVRTISLQGAVSKILCRTHNSDLSPLDSEIKKIKECFKTFSELVAMGQTEKNFLGQIDGAKFERWLLKTTLNVIRAAPQKYRFFWPDNLLVEMAFGKTKFDYTTGQGLYGVNPLLYGHLAKAKNSVNIRPIILELEGKSCLLGSLITFYGMFFFLNTIDPVTENLVQLQVQECPEVNLIDRKLYHLPQIRTLTKNGLLDHQKLIFSYDTK